MEILDCSSSLNDPIRDYTYFNGSKRLSFSFKKLCEIFYKKIQTPLTLAGLKKGLNNIITFTNTNQLIWNPSKIQMQDMNTKDGHEGCHVDLLLINPITGEKDIPIEVQLQDYAQYISDIIGLSAHGLMERQKN